MDDYEEGTWTPTILDSAGASGGTSTAEGCYTKTGRVVTVHGVIITNSAGSTTSSNGVRIGGLPFTVANIFSATSIEASGSVSFFNSFASSISFIAVSATDGSNLSLHSLASSTTHISALTWATM